MRSTINALLICILALGAGCGNPQSKLVGNWVSSKDKSEINIEKNGDVFTVEVVQNGQSRKFPGTYKDGTLTIQNMWGTVSFYPDKNSGDLIANMGGQEDHLHRK